MIVTLKVKKSRFLSYALKLIFLTQMPLATPSTRLKNCHFLTYIGKLIAILDTNLENRPFRIMSNKFLLSGPSSSRKSNSKQDIFAGHVLSRPFPALSQHFPKLYGRISIFHNHFDIGINCGSQKKIELRLNEQLDNIPFIQTKKSQSDFKKSLEQNLNNLPPAYLNLDSSPYVYEKSKNVTLSNKRNQEKLDYSTAIKTFHSQQSCIFEFDLDKIAKSELAQNLVLHHLQNDKYKGKNHNFMIQGSDNLEYYWEKNKFPEDFDFTDECIPMRLGMEHNSYAPSSKSLSDLRYKFFRSIYSQNDRMEGEILNSNHQLKADHKMTVEVITYGFFSQIKNLLIIKSKMGEHNFASIKSNHLDSKSPNHRIMNNSSLKILQLKNDSSKNSDDQQFCLSKKNGDAPISSDLDKMKGKTTVNFEENKASNVSLIFGPLGNDTFDSLKLPISIRDDLHDAESVKILVKTKKRDFNDFLNIHSAGLQANLESQVGELTFHFFPRKDDRIKESPAVFELMVVEMVFETNLNGKKSYSLPVSQFENIFHSLISNKVSQFTNMIFPQTSIHKDISPNNELFVMHGSSTSVNEQSSNTLPEVIELDFSSMECFYKFYEQSLPITIDVKGKEHVKFQTIDMQLKARCYHQDSQPLHDTFNAREQTLNYSKKSFGDDLSKELKGLVPNLLSVVRDWQFFDQQDDTIHFINQFSLLQPPTGNQIKTNIPSHSQFFIKNYPQPSQVSRKKKTIQVNGTDKNKSSISCHNQRRNIQFFARPPIEIKQEKPNIFSIIDHSKFGERKMASECGNKALLPLHKKHNHESNQKDFGSDMRELEVQFRNEFSASTDKPFIEPQIQQLISKNSVPYEPKTVFKDTEKLEETGIIQASIDSYNKSYVPKIKSICTPFNQYSQDIGLDECTASEQTEKESQDEKVQESKKPVIKDCKISSGPCKKPLNMITSSTANDISEKQKFELISSAKTDENCNQKNLPKTDPKSDLRIYRIENVVLSAEKSSEMNLINPENLINQKTTSPVILAESYGTRYPDRQKSRTLMMNNSLIEKGITEENSFGVDTFPTRVCKDQINKKAFSSSKPKENNEQLNCPFSYLMEPEPRKSKRISPNTSKKNTSELKGQEEKEHENANANERSILGDNIWRRAHVRGSTQSEIITENPMSLSIKSGDFEINQRDHEHFVLEECKISQDIKSYEEDSNAILLPKIIETQKNKLSGKTAVASVFVVNDSSQVKCKNKIFTNQKTRENKSVLHDRKEVGPSKIDELISRTEAGGKSDNNSFLANKSPAYSIQLLSKVSPAKSIISSNLLANPGKDRQNSKDKLSVSISPRKIQQSSDNKLRTIKMTHSAQNVSDGSCLEKKEKLWKQDDSGSNELTTRKKDVIENVQNVTNQHLPSLIPPHSFVQKNIPMPNDLNLLPKSPLKSHQSNMPQFLNSPSLDDKRQEWSTNNINESILQKKKDKTTSPVISTANSRQNPCTDEASVCSSRENFIKTYAIDQNVPIQETRSTKQIQTKCESRKIKKIKFPPGSKDEISSVSYQTCISTNNDLRADINQEYSNKHPHLFEKARECGPTELRHTSNYSCSIKNEGLVKRSVLNFMPSDETLSNISQRKENSDFPRSVGRNKIHIEQESTRERNLEISPENSSGPQSDLTPSRNLKSKLQSNSTLDKKPISNITRSQTIAVDNSEIGNLFSSLSNNSRQESGARRDRWGLSQQITTPHSPQQNPPPSIPQPNEGRVRSKAMAEVYVNYLSHRNFILANDLQIGTGEGYISSPRSPTRPPSLRRRQSMKVLELESKVEQLSEKNRILIEEKERTEKEIKLSMRISSSDKDVEINALKCTIGILQEEALRLIKMNECLNKPTSVVPRQSLERNIIHETQQTKTLLELAQARDALHRLSTNMQSEIQTIISTKNQDIAELRAELKIANQKIQETQKQILLFKASDLGHLNIKDEKYFEKSCQSLCQHVQHWVLRFSKYSDMKTCKLTGEISDEKIVERLDNTILDGIDVDTYLSNRIKRRDVFMSIVMTMVWEFIFTRYLFGMDRDQRQKLKYLEKTLSEVGPVSAVNSWRATTLSLLSKRSAFVQQRDQDTQAVVGVILETLSEILPPPSNLKEQIEEQLNRVMKEAASLAVDMRCQKTEYFMCPPMQPEYDSDGKIKNKILFNASSMNECSDDSEPNKELEASLAIVRIALFPLIVKKHWFGESKKEIVIWPAQVLVVKDTKLMIDDDDVHSKFSSKSNITSIKNE